MYFKISFSHYHLLTHFNIFIQSMLKVDPSLTCSETTQAQLTRHTEFIRFMKTHCHERAYSFQVQILNNYNMIK